MTDEKKQPRPERKSEDLQKSIGGRERFSNDQGLGRDQRTTDWVKPEKPPRR
jgi:hypothetical protein